MNVESLTPELGVRVRPTDTPEPARLDLDAVRDAIRRHGVVLFDGFNGGLEAYEKFSENFGETLTGLPGDGANKLSGRRDVYRGRDRLSAHSEDTYTPWPPDLLWLYCIRPAAAGGRTTAYDGIRLLDQLSAQSRACFATRQLRFTQFFSAAAWRSRFGETEQMIRATYSHPDLSFEFRKGGILKVQFITSAIRRTRYQGCESFTNSVLHALDAADFYGLDLADGAPIPPEAERELRSIADSIEMPIPWTAGSFAVIDNTRVMHGREAYTDTARSVVARHQRAKF